MAECVDLFKSEVLPSSGELDSTELPVLDIVIGEANTRADVGAMANVFIKSFVNDRTAQLLYTRDRIWPVVLEMLRNYVDDDNTQVLVAWDDTTNTIVGWTSVSLVTSDQGDYFASYDSIVWAGRRLLRSEARNERGEPQHLDQMRRASLINQLRERNRDGQIRHTDRQRLLINTIAIDTEVGRDEVEEIAYKLLNETRDHAKSKGLPLYAQFAQHSLGDLEDLCEEIGFAQVGS